jgi:PAS domain S-box-containing protein
MLDPRNEYDSFDSAVLTLDSSGHITDCSAAAAALFGYEGASLEGEHVSLVLPCHAGIELVERGELNRRLNYMSHCGVPFQARHRNGQAFSTELFFNRPGTGQTRELRVLVRSLAHT